MFKNSFVVTEEYPNGKITFHIGPRKCGKSLFVEEEFRLSTNKLYIGTLPVLPQYLDTIEKHIERRGVNWETFDVTKNLQEDLSRLEVLILKRSINVCLIDGITTWYDYLKESSNLCIQIFTETLINFIKAHDIIWRLIDVNPEIFKGVDSDWLAYKTMHINLIKHLFITNIIDWRYE